MSLHITAVFQANDGTRWVDVPSAWEQESDQALFEWLGSGDNGPDSFGLDPLPSRRGAPADFELVDGGTFHPIASVDIHAPSRRLMQARLREGQVGYRQVCMGSADLRWLPVAEILGAVPPRVSRTVAVPIKVFQGWDGSTLPSRWQLLPTDWARRQPASSGVCARPHDIVGTTRQVAIDWAFDFAPEFGYFLDELHRLQATNGEVRIVYAFY